MPFARERNYYIATCLMEVEGSRCRELGMEESIIRLNLAMGVLRRGACRVLIDHLIPHKNSYQNLTELCNTRMCIIMPCIRKTLGTSDVILRVCITSD